ncbi:MAG: transposase, partial [Verrucomicrobiota bacterium]|nr:transposase [Verrucomicrobiota bacterium]
MARKNRVSVYDGVYHVTTRIANRAMLLKPDEVKERLMKWIVSVANFSGVEVWGFTVMDNHLHLIVHVPPVPKEYWLDANEEPAAYAFGMRPPECRVPLWNG